MSGWFGRDAEAAAAANARAATRGANQLRTEVARAKKDLESTKAAVLSAARANDSSQVTVLLQRQLREVRRLPGRRGSRRAGRVLTRGGGRRGTSRACRRA